MPFGTVYSETKTIGFLNSQAVRIRVNTLSIAVVQIIIHFKNNSGPQWRIIFNVYILAKVRT
jgi:hypothetical protein